MSKKSSAKSSAKKSSAKSSAKKKGGKRRVVIQLPPGSPLDTMSPDEFGKHVEDLVGKSGIGNRHTGGRVEELLVEIADSSSSIASSPSASLAPPDGWGARWSRRCAL